MTVAPDPLDGSFSAAWLMDQEFPPINYAVEGIVPEGLTIIAAPPKLGKSWLVLDIALTVSAGAVALGAIEVQRRPVLYMALEDGPRRLQNRLQKLGAIIGGDDLHFITDAGTDPLGIIGTFIHRHADRKPLVIVDTLGKIKGIYNGNDAYAHDYAQAAALKHQADQVPGSSVLVVHHTNKGAKDDFVDSVSGTHGIAGAADTIITMTRSRNDDAGILNVTSRDAAEGRYAVTFDDGKWTLTGGSLEEAAHAADDREATAGVSDDMGTIVGVVQGYPDGIQRKQVIEATGLSPQKVDTYLGRAVEAGRISRAGRGTYIPVRSERSVRFEEDPDDPKLTHLTHLTGLEGENN